MILFSALVLTAHSHFRVESASNAAPHLKKKVGALGQLVDGDDTFALLDGNLLGLDNSFPNFRADAEEARFLVMTYKGIAHFKSLKRLPAPRHYLVWFHGLQLDHCLVRNTTYYSTSNDSNHLRGTKLRNDRRLSVADDLEDTIGSVDSVHFPVLELPTGSSFVRPNRLIDDECDFLEYVKTRDDVLWVNFDLADHVLTSDDPVYRLRGITVPPPNVVNVFSDFTASTRPYFLTFRGTLRPGWLGSSNARPDVARMFRNHAQNGVVVEFKNGGNVTDQDRLRFKELLNSSFGLVLHGDGRWNYRLNDVVASCSSPVIVADGLELPFAQLIRWNESSIVVPESETASSSSADDFMKHLPTDVTRIEEMNKKSCEIQNLFFRNITARGKALLQCALILVT